MLLQTDRPYFEHVISIEGTQSDVHEEEALHLLRVAHLMHFVENHPNGEYAQEVLEFITFLKIDDNGTLSSRLSFLTNSKSKTHKYVMREVTLSLNEINSLFELNHLGENPALYMFGREQEFLDKITTQPVLFKVRTRGA